MNLQDVFSAINEVYFGGLVEGVKLKWMRRTKGPRKAHNVNLGLCHYEERVIEINPLVALPEVSWAFQSYIMFHEVCHLISPPRKINEKLVHHHPDFFALESRYQHFTLAQEWHKENIEWLMQQDTRKLVLE